MVRRRVSDGGRQAFGYESEKNDCSVVALSHALDITYEEAYKMLDGAGRRKNKGWYTIEFFQYCGFNGWKHETTKFARGKRPTEMEFAESHPKGRFLVYTEGHLIAVVDGVIHDNRPHPARAKVQYAWKMIKTA